MDEDALLQILSIPHAIAPEGGGLSLNQAKARANLRALRAQLKTQDILSALQARPKLAEAWLQYSWDKRTTGWYVDAAAGGFEVGKVDRAGEVRPGSFFRFETLEEAVAEFILREL